MDKCTAETNGKVVGYSKFFQRPQSSFMAEDSPYFIKYTLHFAGRAYYQIIVRQHDHFLLETITIKWEKHCNCLTSNKVKVNKIVKFIPVLWFWRMEPEEIKFSSTIYNFT